MVGSELVLFILEVALLATSSVEYLSLTFQRYVCVCLSVFTCVCVCVCVCACVRACACVRNYEYVWKHVCT